MLSDCRWKSGLLFRNRNRKAVLNFLLSVTRSDESCLMVREVRIRHWNVPNMTFTRPDGHLHRDCSQNPMWQRMMKTGSDVFRPSSAALLLASVLRFCSMTVSSLYHCGISLHLRLLSQCDPSWYRSVPSGRSRGLLSNTSWVTLHGLLSILSLFRLTWYLK